MTSTPESVHNEPPLEPMLRAALSLACEGIPIFPCDPRTKQPLTRHGFKDATTDRAIIESWWSEYPDAMIGMPTGRITGVFVVDLDTKHDGPKHFAALCEQHGGAPVTRTATTPTLGSHLHYRYPEDRHIRNSAGKLGRGIDIRGEGGYIILPPSRRNDGASYCWDIPDGEVSVADAPEWLLDEIDRRARLPTPPPVNGAAGSSWAQAALQSELGRVLSASERERNDTLNRASFALG